MCNKFALTILLLLNFASTSSAKETPKYWYKIFISGSHWTSFTGSSDMSEKEIINSIKKPGFLRLNDLRRKGKDKGTATPVNTVFPNSMGHTYLNNQQITEVFPLKGDPIETSKKPENEDED